jgi:transcription antitermination factor NusG
MLQKQLGLESYLPFVQQRSRGRLEQVVFFPGYLLVYVDLDVIRQSSINATPGIIGLLDFGGGAQPIPESVVGEIRHRVAELNARGGLPVHNFALGDTLVVKDGPLSGLEVVFAGPSTAAHRVCVFLEFMGRLSRVQLDAELLEQRTVSERQHPPRRTRGRGRSIHVRKLEQT